MSVWHEVSKEDIELHGDELNILVRQDYAGNVYVTVKVADIKTILAEPLNGE